VKRRSLHFILFPLYLGLCVVVGGILYGVPPSGALYAAGIAAAMAMLPSLTALAGFQKSDVRFVRFALLLIIIEIASLGFILSPGRSVDYGVTTLDATTTTSRLKHASEIAFPQVIDLAKNLAEKGPRHTGSPGLDATLEFVQQHLAAQGWNKVVFGDPASLGARPENQTVRRTNFPVLAPLDTGSDLIVGDGAESQKFPAFALTPNAVQPCATVADEISGALVYLGLGSDDELDGQTIDKKIAVFEFASADRWLWACEHGALGAVFLESADDIGHTVRHADQKFLALLPLNFPRIYVAQPHSEKIRELARAGKSAVLHSGMQLKTVSAPVLEATIPGTASTRELLIMGHADARSVAPGLSFGGQEVFGLASWLALFDYFAQHPPAFSLRFVLNTGHWQQQSSGRAYAYAIKEALGEQIAMAIGVDLNPEAESLILTDDTAGDSVRAAQYWWLKKLLFTIDRRQPGWIDQIESLSNRKPVDRGGTPAKFSFFGGRPSMPGSQWSLWLAPADQWPPTSHSASHPAANQMISQIGGCSIALATCGTYRQRHFTCHDTIDPWLDKTENLRPQLELTFALIGALADLDPARFPVYPAVKHEQHGGYNQVDVQVLRWDPSILWYQKTPPADRRTFVMLVPTDSRFTPGRTNAYWPRESAPNRFSHRMLQCMQTTYTAEVDAAGHASFNNIYTAGPHVLYDAIALTLDQSGHITHAFDQGFHGDAEFKFLDRKLGAAKALIQVPTFECGSLAMFSLSSPDRQNVGRIVENEYRNQWGHVGNDQDEAEVPYLPVKAVNEAATHTSADSFAWMQYRHTAMVFLKPNLRCEILAGSSAQRYVLLNDDPALRADLEKKSVESGIGISTLVSRLDSDGSSTAARPASGDSTATQLTVPYLGFRVGAGEERRILNGTHLSLEQLSRLTVRRLEEYAAVNVKSPSASLYQERALAESKHAAADAAAGKQTRAATSEQLAWADQSHAYASTYRLLLDVVTTTIFYFLLLLPFGFLVERLLFPQKTLPRTCLTVAAVFSVFSGLLYIFHPGFHLASNIFVTVVSFVIVILTIPAFLIIVARGTALLMEPGANFKKRHSADAEKWGVLASALSLAVNNMRRRKLRTGLTLATITLLVTSLVLLTSTTADTFFDQQKQVSPRVPYRGVQVMNTNDHTHGMNADAANLLRARYRDRAHVVLRRYFNPGHEAFIPAVAISADKLKTDSAANGRMFKLRGAIAIDPIETQITHINQAITVGRYFQDNDVRACLLAEDTAANLKLKVGDTVRFLGTDLQLIGLLRSSDVDAQIVDVCGKSVTPQAFYRPALNVDSPDHLVATESIFVPTALIETEAPAPFPVFSVVVVPRQPDGPAIEKRRGDLAKWLAAANADTFGTLGERLVRVSKGALTSSEAARYADVKDDAAAVTQLAAYNLERLNLKSIAEEIAAHLANIDVYLTHPAAPWETDALDKVVLISAYARVSLQSGSFLALPFLISFFMLLAIMIGNVYERRTEIQVFSSVGLAPRHVAGMFLAEALVYAGIASVLGYFIGIILLDVFRRAGWLPPDFHANYFGKVVIWSAVLATSSSLLSVLYPMHIASRMVNPSLERVWRIESAPVGDNWRIALPFLASDPKEVIGILQFAREFLSHHRGERTGAFALEADPHFDRMQQTPVLRGMVWLSPFERNLVQQIAIVPRHDAEKNRYHFDLESTRVSGPDYLWRKANHAFVDGLRKQMLIWRSLDDALVAEYVSAGSASVSAHDPSAKVATND
jgi:ABC-type lipoprotein release transport system permease subunit